VKADAESVLISNERMQNRVNNQCLLENVNLSYALHMTSNDKRYGLVCEVLDEYNDHNADGCVCVRCTQHNRQSARCRIAQYAQSTPMCILDAQATDCATRLCVHSQFLPVSIMTMVHHTDLLM
jgi:hypothetical protein